MGDVVDHQRGMRLLVRRGAYAAAAAYALALERTSFYGQIRFLRT